MPEPSQGQQQRDANLSNVDPADINLDDAAPNPLDIQCKRETAPTLESTISIKGNRLTLGKDVYLINKIAWVDVNITSSGTFKLDIQSIRGMRKVLLSPVATPVLERLPVETDLSAEDVRKLYSLLKTNSFETTFLFHPSDIESDLKLDDTKTQSPRTLWVEGEPHFSIEGAKLYYNNRAYTISRIMWMETRSNGSENIDLVMTYKIGETSAHLSPVKMPKLRDYVFQHISGEDLEQLRTLLAENGYELSIKEETPAESAS